MFNVAHAVVHVCNIRMGEGDPTQWMEDVSAIPIDRGNYTEVGCEQVVAEEEMRGQGDAASNWPLEPLKQVVLEERVVM